VAKYCEEFNETYFTNAYYCPGSAIGGVIGGAVGALIVIVVITIVVYRAWKKKVAQ
jgi:hypothetical protein